MACLFLDSCSDGQRTLGKYAATQYTSYTAGGRTADGYSSTGPAWNTKLTIDSAPSTIIVGKAVKVSSNTTVNTSNGEIQLYSDSGTIAQISVALGDGYVNLIRGTTIIATSATTPIVGGSWHYLELKVFLDNSSGTAEARVDGTSVVSFSGDTLNGGTAAVDQVRFGTASSITQTWDDIYVFDTSGTANNDFAGDVTVQALLPTGNGTYSQLVGSDGNSTNNYQLVDEGVNATGTDYVGSGTATERDTYAIGNLTGTIGSVRAVQISSLAAKDTAGTISFKPVVYQGGSLYYGDTHAPSTTYANFRDIFETDPDTAVAWTESGVNSIEAGFEVV